jgi:CDP-diacylglycerol--glycerol-3-phosphate 3-phosphatidyltransferase
MALNAMDGMAAREHGMRTRLGGVLNEIGDVVSDVALILPLATLEPRLLWPAVALALGAVLTEFCGVLGAVVGGDRRYDGPMGKSDRAFAFGLLALLLGLGVAPGPWSTALLAAVAVLAAATIVNRGRRALARTGG